MGQFQWNIWLVNVVLIYGIIIWPDSDTPVHFCRTVEGGSGIEIWTMRNAYESSLEYDNYLFVFLHRANQWKTIHNSCNHCHQCHFDCCEYAVQLIDSKRMKWNRIRNFYVFLIDSIDIMHKIHSLNTHWIENWRFWFVIPLLVRFFSGIGSCYCQNAIKTHVWTRNLVLFSENCAHIHTSHTFYLSLFPALRVYVPLSTSRWFENRTESPIECTIANLAISMYCAVVDFAACVQLIWLSTRHLSVKT